MVERSMTSTTTSEYVLDDTALDTLFREARTANTFTDEPVSVEEIRAVHALTKFGPTAMNNQPLRIVLVQSPDARARLVEHMSGSNKAKTSTAPLVAILAADTDFHDHLPEFFPPFPGARDMYDADEAMRFQQAEFNAALQIGYFLMGVRATGLAAGPMAGFDRGGVDRDFLGGTSWRSQLVVNLGHPGPDAWQERLPRIEFDDAVRVV